MNDPVSRQEEPEECVGAPSKVWEQLDATTRARVIDLFSHLAYRLVISKHQAEKEEDNDVS